MEAFSLLKYWRSGNGGASPMMGNAPVSYNATQKIATTDTTAITLLRHSTSSDSSSSLDGDEDDGPFFDLEFSVPDDYEELEGNHNGEVEEKCRGASLSHSDHAFFKGRLSSVESSSSDDTAGKHHQLLPAGILKSANKFSVFRMKDLKKPKSSVPAMRANQIQHQKSGNRFFAVKFKVEEVPIISLFTRDNSSRRSGRKHAAVDEHRATLVGGRKSSKEVVNKYLNKIKPLYVKISRRSTGEKIRSSASPPEKIFQMDTTFKEEVEKKLSMTHLQNRVDNGLRVVKKHLGKSRSASSAVASVPSPSPVALLVARGRDDSLLQQQDGIQSAIAHCKRSFNVSSEVESSQSTLPRSKSDSFDERSLADLEKRKEDDCI